MTTFVSLINKPNEPIRSVRTDSQDKEEIQLRLKRRTDVTSPIKKPSFVLKFIVSKV